MDGEVWEVPECRKPFKVIEATAETVKIEVETRWTRGTQVKVEIEAEIVFKAETS